MLRRLHRGDMIGLPHCRPMPTIGPRCHELRIQDKKVTRRIIYRLDSDALIIGDVFPKKTGKTPKKVLDACKQRFKRYDEATK